MSKVAVIDYDAGNTLSVIKALEFLGMDVELTRDAKALRSCEKVIFPGVGAYFDAMQKLKEYKLTDTVKELALSDTPFLGICLGMQLLFDSSEERIGSDNADRDVDGLKLLRGNIKLFKDIEPYKIPHMGWNSVNVVKPDSRLFKGLPASPYVYFVHLYYLKAEDRSDVLATADYGITFDCAVEKGNLFGCQFHPEKSGDIGLEILKNFCNV